MICSECIHGYHKVCNGCPCQHQTWTPSETFIKAAKSLGEILAGEAEEAEAVTDADNEGHLDREQTLP